ncbi:hypothetical protein A2W24_05640 [Microgenomates group bacterium RBG_16_45_19]|nr:MAG: hypothetical protein A2W24_05640 [Microgenomates group bacterium RBG_16_45_19]
MKTLGELASKSLVFRQLFSTASYTSTAHASVFTGLNPPKHNVRALLNPQIHSLKQAVMTMAEVMAEAGYLTVLASDEPTMLEPMGLDRGFQVKIPISDQKLFRFIQANRQKKMFVFKHFFDVHDPYLLPRDQAKPADWDRYYEVLSTEAKVNHLASPSRKKDPYMEWRRIFGGEKNQYQRLFPLYLQGVELFDQGRLKRFIDRLEAIGELSQALLVIFSDHGEGRCFRHKPYFAHGGDLYEEIVQVPLLIHTPQLKPGLDNRLASITDIFPTLIKLGLGKTPEYYPTYPIDGLNLISSQKHQQVYAEYWRSDKEHPQDYPTNDHWLLAERMLRTTKRKVRLVAQPERVGELNMKASINTQLPRLLQAIFSEIRPGNGLNEEILMSYITTYFNQIENPPLTFGQPKSEWLGELPSPYNPQISLRERWVLKQMVKKLLAEEKPRLLPLPSEWRRRHPFFDWIANCS